MASSKSRRSPVLASILQSAGGVRGAFGAADPAEMQLVMVDLDLIDPRPDQPRRHFDEDALQALADSIKRSGLKQPVGLRQKPDGRYVLVFGERCFRAHRIAGFDRISGVVVNDGDPDELALVENIQREDLSPIETARALQRLVRDSGVEQQVIGAIMGLSPSKMSRYMAILELPSAILSEAEGRPDISMTALVEVARAASDSERDALWEAAKSNISTRSLAGSRTKERVRRSDHDGGGNGKGTATKLARVTKVAEELVTRRDELTDEDRVVIRGLRDALSELLGDA